MPQLPFLTINTGSSSLKFGLYDPVASDSAADPALLLDGQADGIGQSRGTLQIKDPTARVLRSEPLPLGSQAEALDRAAAWLAELSPMPPCAIGHRVVHGGPQLVTHQAITPALIDTLRACVHFAPLHIPLALELIESAQRIFPNTPQFACFDTAFHRTLPEAAAHFALPQSLFDQGIRRFGFHGLSYESIVHQLGANLPSRTVIAHLGSGASLAALKDGLSVDTTMGLTPTGGIPMATRSGDLDPGVLLFLLRSGNSPDSLETLLNHASGLTALSGGRSDMRDLQTAAEAHDPAAALAIDIFCNSIAKVVAGYATVLDSLDLLVFAGGIGEHSGLVRSRICRRLSFLGLALDDAANTANAPTLSTPASSIRVAIVPSREDLQIARHTRDLLTP